MNLSNNLFKVIFSITALFLLFSCEDEPKSEVPKELTPEENISAIRKLTSQLVDSIQVTASETQVEFKLYIAPQELIMLQRNELFTDSVLLLLDEHLLVFDHARFHYIADTSTRENAEFLRIAQGEETLKTEVCFITRNLNGVNQQKIGQKFESPTYMKMTRVILKDCTTEELANFQYALDLMIKQLTEEEFTTDFIKTVCDLGFKMDQKKNFQLELGTIQRMINIAPQLEEANFHINTDILNKILLIVSESSGF